MDRLRPAPRAQEQRLVPSAWRLPRPHRIAIRWRATARARLRQPLAARRRRPLTLRHGQLGGEGVAHWQEAEGS
eukprot:4240856-Alexandrium_andersonii.AAC.1